MYVADHENGQLHIVDRKALKAVGSRVQQPPGGGDLNAGVAVA